MRDGHCGKCEAVPTLRRFFGARYDVFDPSKNVDRNSLNAIAVFANWMPHPGLQVLGECRGTSTEAGVTPGEDKDDRLQLLFTFIK